ncbi:hypothetical protein NEMBOFW57_002129 [Staphylotrichum longicolle]|uniref:ERF1 methyltransferase catalytic subunit MTQ2 n=1 Tax=Staphylotrichum longicolle TaxID=669026 RepID=A0AAD4I288_9PEZI|nr:hypothetical protein NEMBOFW57_002129 [Staphylotrichum longicolle]
MLPTPSTSHVPYARVYEPAEDSFLLLDTLSAPSETAFLAARFPSSSSSSSSPSSPPPLVLEVGPGSGVVLAFLTAHAAALFSRRDVLTLGVDVNRFACAATGETVRRAVRDDSASSSGGGDNVSVSGSGAGYFLGAAQGDLAGAVRPGTVDVLVFNPPYVPTAELPSMRQEEGGTVGYEEDSRLLALSYAGGRDGMEVTERLIEALPGVLSGRGVAYLLLCAQNKPEEVKARIRKMGREGEWRAETVGTSGKQAGWEKLQIVRIWRD